MAMSITLSEYLATHDSVYSVMHHDHTTSSLETAEAAHVPGDLLVKPVILHDDRGYVMAVVPATHRVRLDAINRLLKRNLAIATEQELAELFDDCEVGAVPPLGQMYGMQTIWDDALGRVREVYFESGDHETLVHMAGEQFMALMSSQEHAPISAHL